MYNKYIKYKKKYLDLKKKIGGSGRKFKIINGKLTNSQINAFKATHTFYKAEKFKSQYEENKLKKINNNKINQLKKNHDFYKAKLVSPVLKKQYTINGIENIDYADHNSSEFYIFSIGSNHPGQLMKRLSITYDYIANNSYSVKLINYDRNLVNRSINWGAIATIHYDQSSYSNGNERNIEGFVIRLNKKEKKKLDRSEGANIYNNGKYILYKIGECDFGEGNKNIYAYIFNTRRLIKPQVKTKEGYYKSIGLTKAYSKYLAGKPFNKITFNIRVLKGNPLKSKLKGKAIVQNITENMFKQKLSLVNDSEVKQRIKLSFERNGVTSNSAPDIVSIYNDRG